MGEAKRREQLGLPPRKKIELNKSDRYLSWLPITKSRIKKYPYMGVATMALGAIIFLVIGSHEKYLSDLFNSFFCLGGNPNSSLLLASPIILNLFMYQY